MNLDFLNQLLGPFFVLAFFGLILIFAAAGRNRPGRNLREIPAYQRLRRAVGLAVESGARIHVALGSGGVTGPQGAPTLQGLSVLERIGRAASISDKPPIATSGEGVTAILSQDSLHSVARSLGAESQFDPSNGQMTGLSPLAYAAGAMAVIHEERPSANILAGHFGVEAALMVEAGERVGGLTVAGSDQISAQAALYATAQEPLIGEDLFASAAYLNAGAMHSASLRTQDVFRWLLIVAILGGAIARLFNFI